MCSYCPPVSKSLKYSAFHIFRLGSLYDDFWRYLLYFEVIRSDSLLGLLHLIFASLKHHSKPLVVASECEQNNFLDNLVKLYILKEKNYILRHLLLEALKSPSLFERLCSILMFKYFMVIPDISMTSWFCIVAIPFWRCALWIVKDT